METFNVPALAVLIAALVGGANSNRPDRVIRVSGEGVATAKPDVATVNTGAVTRAASATEAVAANNRVMKEVLASLKKLDIAEDDVQTTNFGVRPVYKRDGRDRVTSEIEAYEVSNRVRVRVRKLGELGKVLDAAVGAGSNRVSGIEFTVSDATAVRDQARRRAVADARHRADVLAKEAGVRVGCVVSLQEQSVYRPQSRFDAGAALARAPTVPVATGREEFRVTVQVVFEIADQSPARGGQP
ncbi:MAG: SIMPL domain-containing protein [Planctomycetes bacterium]|nr:SIMPL domain-containing protein [Planctomycetota bacterium]